MLLFNLECESYTEMRRKREEFRRKLVELIMTDCGSNDYKEDFPNASEKNILKYYHYIRHGIDTVHIAPMHQKIITK